MVMETDTVSELIEHLGDKRLGVALKINGTVRSYMSEYLRTRGYLEVPPVIFSTVTDPLNHPVVDPSFDYDGVKYALTKSMIFHKQMLVQKFEKIFTFSPNIRLELPEKASTGRHLLEFTQIDIEQQGATREQMMALAEDMLVSLFRKVNATHASDLESIGRTLSVPEIPFRKYKYLDAEKEYGLDFENVLSGKSASPFWIVDIPLDKREFYDREKADEPGILSDMDLVYPEGFCEALSGGEREYDMKKILERIAKKDQTEEQFKWFLEFAKYGLKPSCGFGIGIERLVRFICGFQRIEMAHPFPKVPGRRSI